MSARNICSSGAESYEAGELGHHSTSLTRHGGQFPLAGSGSKRDPAAEIQLAPGSIKSVSVSDASGPETPSPHEPWSTTSARAALEQLDGVVSANLVEDDGGVLREIHVLASCDQPARSLVREIEGTLLDRFGHVLDRRIVSIAQFAEDANTPAQITLDPYPEVPDVADRLILEGLRTVGRRDTSVSVVVRLASGVRQFTGAANGADVAPRRFEVYAEATLRAVQAAVQSAGSRSAEQTMLVLDGVTLLDEFDADTVLVSVTALEAAGPVTLAGTAVVDGSHGQAVVLATMQATDRWARGHMTDLRN